MKGTWWKLLGVIILIYVFLTGLLVPLKPGIIAAEPSTAKCGQELKMTVKGYNSHFLTAAGQIGAWLKQDEKNALKAVAISPVSEQELQLTFDIPAFLNSKKQVKDFTLILDNPVDGPSVLPSAVFISQDSINPQMAAAEWQQHSLTDLHEKSAFNFPFRNILSETIRNTYFHVPQWFAMLFIFLGGVIYSFFYLKNGKEEDDLRAAAFTRVGILFGIMGLVTGAIWANYTWGKPWSWDIKQNMTAIALLIYFAYFVLRSSFDDPEKRARLSAVYNLFAFATLIPLLYVIPRMTDSLHPGSGGNPAMGGEDLDNTMRMVFYPAIIGWTLVGFWMANLNFRIEKIRWGLLQNAD